MEAFSGYSRRFIKRYLTAIEVLSILAVGCMGYLLYKTLSPAGGAGLFVDVVSGAVFAVVGRNSF